MKIGILGAGAMGCNIGGHLKLGGAEVWLIDPFEEHMKKVSENGIIWVETNGHVCDPIFVDGAVTTPAECGECDAVIILTKCQYLREALAGAELLFGPATTVITFQNGVGAADILAERFPAERIGYGVMYCGGQLIEPGRSVMSRSPDRNVIFKRMKGGRNEVFAAIEEYFNNADFPVEYTDDADIAVWTKLGVNCIANLPMGLMHLPSYYAYLNEDGNALVESIADEVVAVADAAGYRIKREEILRVRQMTIDTKYTTLTSGAADVKNKRSTEVDFLNGAVARIGRELGIPAPVNETIARMIRCVERTYEYQF